jgi:hypothetical protein
MTEPMEQEQEVVENPSNATTLTPGIAEPQELETETEEEEDATETEEY